MNFLRDYYTEMVNHGYKKSKSKWGLQPYEGKVKKNEIWIDRFVTDDTLWYFVDELYMGGS